MVNIIEKGEQKMVTTNERTITIREAIEDNSVSLIDFYNALHDIEIGNWDGINSRDIIEQYLCEMIPQGIVVSHIVEALEKSWADIFAIWLGDSAETPEPIETKEDLVEALEIDDEELDELFYPD